MKKALLLFTFICISNLLFSQTEKGTHFLGTSHISEYRSGFNHFFEKGSLRERSFSFQYGIFIKDNVLIGATFSNSPDIIHLPSLSRTNSLALNPFYRRYFGQKRIRPFAEAEIGVKLIGDFYFQAGIRPGVALFLNSNTSLDLSFNFLLIDNYDFFPQGVAPEIGLALRFFLKYDKENIPQITAREMLKRGILSADLSSSQFGFDNIIRHTNVGLKYFLLDNIYLSGGLSMYSEKFSGLSVFRGDIQPEIGIGGYYFSGDFMALTVQANGQKRLIKNKQGSQERTVDIMDAEAKAGLALFLGRQKIELLAGIAYTKYEASFPSLIQSDNNFIASLGYEYFISDKLSVNTSISAYPENQKQRVEFNLSSNYFERYDLDLNVQLKWYIGTRKLKEEEKN